MPPEGKPVDDWIRHARSDLAVVRSRTDDDDLLLDTLAFHCQQSAEKAVKAVLVARGIRVPKSHNLRSLLALVPDQDYPHELADHAAELSEYAVGSRYPGVLEPVTSNELETAFATADAMVQWAMHIVRQIGADDEE